MSLQSFVKFMEYPHMRQYVRKLVIDPYMHTSLEGRDTTAGRIVCSLLSSPVAATVRHLHITSGNLAWITLTPPGLTTQFSHLRSLSLDRANLPLLYCILRQSPNLKTLRITGMPHWPTSYRELYQELFLEWERQRPTPKALDLLDVSCATSSTTLQVLERLALLPKEVHMSVNAWNDVGLDPLLQGTAIPWPVFSRASIRIVLFDMHDEERLARNIGAFRAAGFEANLQESGKPDAVTCIKGAPEERASE